MKKAIFLDRDGTINYDKKYVYRIADFQFLPLAIEALQIMINSGYLLFIITNQSGIARGYYSENDCIRLNEWLCTELLRHGVKIEKIYYCPHYPEGRVIRYRKECNCRKPQIGMFEKAISEFDIDINQSIVIGDRLRDCTLALSGMCEGFLVEKTESAQVINLVSSGYYPHIKYKKNLYECAKYIEKNLV